MLLFSVCLAALLAAAYLDFRDGEVPDRLWAAAVLAAFVLQWWGRGFVIGFTVEFWKGVVLFYAAGWLIYKTANAIGYTFGGADFKVFVALYSFFPAYPGGIDVLKLFPLGVLANALFLAIGTVSALRVIEFVDGSKQQKKRKTRTDRGNQRTVPFLPFVAAGFVVTYLFGDLALYIVMMLARMLTQKQG